MKPPFQNQHLKTHQDLLQNIAYIYLFLHVPSRKRKKHGKGKGEPRVGHRFLKGIPLWDIISLYCFLAYLHPLWVCQLLFKCGYLRPEPATWVTVMNVVPLFSHCFRNIRWKTNKQNNQENLNLCFLSLAMQNGLLFLLYPCMSSETRGAQTFLQVIPLSFTVQRWNCGRTWFWSLRCQRNQAGYGSTQRKYWSCDHSLQWKTLSQAPSC